MATCEYVKGIGYHQCPPDYVTLDPWLQSVTEGSLLGEIVRLVANYRPDSGKWSRTTKSAQISKNLELGWSHFASRRGLTTEAQKLFVKIATDLPEIASKAWGPERAEKMRDFDYVNKAFDAYQDMGSRAKGVPGNTWLIDGWHLASQTPGVESLYTRIWFDENVAPVIKELKERGWKNKRSLAAGIRVSVSKPAWWKTMLKESDEEAGVERLLTRYADHSDTYARRAKRIREDPVWDGTVERWPEAGDLDWTRGAPSIDWSRVGLGDIAYAKGGGGGAGGVILAVGVALGLFWLWKKRK